MASVKHEIKESEEERILREYGERKERAKQMRATLDFAALSGTLGNHPDVDYKKEWFPNLKKFSAQSASVNVSNGGRIAEINFGQDVDAGIHSGFGPFHVSPIGITLGAGVRAKFTGESNTDNYGFFCGDPRKMAVIFQNPDEIPIAPAFGWELNIVLWRLRAPEGKGSDLVRPA